MESCKTIPTKQGLPNAICAIFRTLSAEQHFLGKTLEEAEALFRENSLYYQEDLLFMGPIAFRFYVEAAINYLKSESAASNSDMVSCMAGLLENRLEYEASELTPIASRLASLCRYIIDHYERFDVMPEIYGDLRPRYQLLERMFVQYSGAK